MKMLSFPNPFASSEVERPRGIAQPMGVSTSLDTNGKLLMGFAAALLLATPALADGLIENVNGITLDKDGEVVRFTGLLIDRQGKVARTVARGDKLPKELDYRIDGRGKTMLPGLIDAHGQVMGLGFQALTLDLSATNSLTEAQAALKAYADKHPDRRWII